MCDSLMLLLCAWSIIITINNVLGEFGIVYKGYIIKEQGSIVTDTVAIKTLKGIESNVMHPCV